MKPNIIIPYRDRPEHLSQFLDIIKDYLPEAKIYVIEQQDDRPFNRAKLFNAAFIETSSVDTYSVFHDVDMMPVHANYSFPKFPTHIATRCSQYLYTMPYPTYFGGVTIFSNEDYIAVDGYNNHFWGWGNEDDEMIFHLKRLHYRIDRRQCVFECLQHERIINKKEYAKGALRARKPRHMGEGLMSTRYQVRSKKEFETHTHISVRL